MKLTFSLVPTHVYALRPLRRDALPMVIEGPARLAGIAVDEDLVKRVVADTDSGEALPLLAFTLAQLGEGVGRGGQLSPRRYDQLGGVHPGWFTVRLWDVRDPHHPRVLGILTGYANPLFSVAFSPDGHTVATASYDATVRLWDVRDPHHPSALGSLTGHTNLVYSVAFSLDGHTVATASADHTARLWDVRAPHHPSALGTLTGHTNSVFSVAFSPDGHTLATASADATVRLWDVRDPHHPSALGSLTGHTNAVTSVAFSPDGHTVVTASGDHTARLWETNVDRVAARICSITPAITNSEWDHYLPGLAYRPPCP